jgi:1-deoxy-D-xylulose-5-phosphate reductoisomerase
LNAANEVAVAEFLEGRLPFNAIAAVIAQAMDAHRPAQVATLAEVRKVDGWARDYSLERARKVQSEIGSLKSEV